MAKRIFTTGSLTFAATGHGSAATTSGYMALKGTTTTQIVDILEVMISGMATASTVAGMMVAYSSTLGTTPTALASPGSDGPMVVNATALASLVNAYFAAGTQPTPSSASHITKAQPVAQFVRRHRALECGTDPAMDADRQCRQRRRKYLVECLDTRGGSSGLANAHIIYEPY